MGFSNFQASFFRSEAPRRARGGACAPRKGAFHIFGLCFLNPNPNLNLNLRPFRAKATEIKITIKIKRGTQKSEMRPPRNQGTARA